MTSRIIDPGDLATAGFSTVAAAWATGIGLLDSGGHPLPILPTGLTGLNGKIGVNNTNPQANLEVGGIVKIGGAPTLAQFQALTTSSPTYISLQVNPDPVLVSDSLAYISASSGTFRMVANVTGTNAEALAGALTARTYIRSTTGLTDYAEAYGSTNSAWRSGSDDIGAAGIYLNGAINASYHDTDLNVNAVTLAARGSNNLVNIGRGSVSEAVGSQNSIIVRNGATVTTGYGVRTTANASGGTLTTFYDVYLGGLSSGTATNNWGVYQANALNTNYFAAKSGFGTTAPSCMVDVADDRIRVRTSKTPATSSSVGDAGSIAWDSSYIYICVATNTWKRSPITTW